MPYLGLLIKEPEGAVLPNPRWCSNARNEPCARCCPYWFASSIAKQTQDLEKDQPQGQVAQGTTSFSVSGVVDSSHVDVSSLDPMIDRGLEVDAIGEVKKYFAKPLVVWNGTFTTSNSVNDLLFTADLRTLFLAQTIWTNKLSGYLNFRGTVKLRLVINPSPFHAGVLRMALFPFASSLPSEAGSHTSYRENFSQLPGVYISMSENAAEMSIPYVSPTHFMTRDVNETPSWGNIYIKVFEALRTGTGSNTVNCALWMSVEDVELAGQVIPQMAYEPQVDNRRRKTRGPPSEQEANDGKGPISTIFGNGYRLARSVAAIPSLAPIAGPASWALKAAEGAASSLGWSKPTIDSGPQRVASANNWYSNNAEGNDSSVPMSLMSDNKLSIITDAAPGDQDEMSINFIKRRWGFVGDFNWPTSTAAGTQIYIKNVRPSAFDTVLTYQAKAVRLMPPMGFLSNMFALWRGSIDVKLKLSKTGYHTGALAVTFVPGTTYPSAPSLADTSYAFRTIIDIQEGDEFCFTLPFLVPKDYLSFTENAGRLYVHVVNPLISNPNVASSIDVMVFARGGTDLEFAAPKWVDMIPVLPEGSYEFEPQGVETENTGEAVCTILGSHDPAASVHHSQLAIGEKVNSVLQLIKASNYIPCSTANGYATKFHIQPYAFYAMRWNLTSWTYCPIGPDALSVIAACFALSRGSMRYLLSCNNAATPTIRTYRALHQPNGRTKVYDNDPAAPYNSILDSDANGTYYSWRSFQMKQNEDCLAVQVPFYSQTRYALNHFRYDTRVFISNEIQPASVLAFSGNMDSKTKLSRSVGEDFQLSYFIGTPMIALSTEWTP